MIIQLPIIHIISFPEKKQNLDFFFNLFAFFKLTEGYKKQLFFYTYRWVIICDIYQIGN